MRERSIAAMLAGGFIVLLIAMGIGRFAYTPLLPPMLTEYGLDTGEAGLLASFNLLGYLAGAFLAGALCQSLGELRVLTAGLLLSAASTAATGVSIAFPFLAAVRLVAGIASALCFIAASSAILTALARGGRERLAGLFYGGVGGGIVLSGLLAPPLAARFGAAGAWLLLGLFSAVVAVPARHLLGRGAEGRPSAKTDGRPPLPRDPRFLRLVAAYGLEGFGYIITGTFLVASARSTFGPAGAAATWIVAGCAALPSAFLWSLAGRRHGPLRPLVGAHLLQAVGIALPALWPQPVAVVAGAFLFGATFMGIVALALGAGGAFFPAARARVLALMTGIYGIGQIIGPSLAGFVAARTGSYDLSLFIAAAAVAAGAVLLLPDAFRNRSA